MTIVNRIDCVLRLIIGHLGKSRTQPQHQYRSSCYNGSQIHGPPLSKLVDLGKSDTGPTPDRVEPISRNEAATLIDQPLERRFIA